LAGALISGFTPGVGLRVFGLGLLGAALWLGRFDIIRFTIRQPGLPRFMAVCLAGGYVWLAVSGLLFLGYGPHESGLHYDAALHAFFVGFVFLMIFAHAPIIFPSVLHLSPMTHRPRFYVHVAALHLSLLLRVSGDLLGWHAGRRWGAILNGVALLVFLINTISAILGRRKA
jgi:hypothetical protein